MVSAKAGKNTLLFSLDLDKVAKMSCNPAIGGPGKSQLVREIDALGGAMAVMTDRSKINTRRLNTSKGRAMRVTRAQVDRDRYSREMKYFLEGQENLVTREATEYRASSVVLTPGTFLRGRVYIGDTEYSAGRTGEPAAENLSESLESVGLNLERMNTDTTPRVNGETIDFSTLDRQETMERPFSFSYKEEKKKLPKDFPVYLTRTNPDTHQVIRDNIDRNPRYNGTVVSAHPRYCPSLESKIIDFPDRKHHKVFLEPESKSSREYYLQGIYTSSPPDVQLQIIRSMEGLEEAHVERWGYGIEYDYLPPTQLKPTLETKEVDGLYTAGQINGTTGYEEAACQGILAGINAAGGEDDQLVLDRSEAFIGVLVDDLVTKGVEEPYRMLPSRAEYRITLRENNADLRLTEVGHKMGTVEEDFYRNVKEKEEEIEKQLEQLKSARVKPNEEINEFLRSNDTSPLEDQGASLYELLKRPELDYSKLKEIADLPENLSEEVVEEIEIRIKYEGYIEKQKKQIEQFRKMEEKELPRDLDYSKIEGLSNQGRE